MPGLNIAPGAKKQDEQKAGAGRQNKAPTLYGLDNLTTTSRSYTLRWEGRRRRGRANSTTGHECGKALSRFKAASQSPSAVTSLDGSPEEGHQVEVEWLILADSSQVVGNKLYLLGGGWDVLTVNSGFPLDQRCAVALAVKIPWNETNRKHTFEVEVLAEDPVTEQPKSMLKVGGQFEVGRPPGIPLGQDQRVQIALETNLRIEAPGI